LLRKLSVNNAYAVHAGMPLMTAWVDSAVFYNMTAPSQWVKVKVFGLTCLAGRVPAFEVLTAEGHVFSDIPPHLVRWKEPAKEPDSAEFTLSELVYNNCLSSTFSLTAFEALAERTAYVYLKSREMYVKGRYWFSLDFYQDNNWFHCIKLHTGHLAFIPSHKLVFPVEGELPLSHVFPKYEKLRQEFRV
jgi:hypothetical protein